MDSISSKAHRHADIHTPAKFFLGFLFPYTIIFSCLCGFTHTIDCLIFPVLPFVCFHSYLLLILQFHHITFDLFHSDVYLGYTVRTLRKSGPHEFLVEWIWIFLGTKFREIPTD